MTLRRKVPTVRHSIPLLLAFVTLASQPWNISAQGFGGAVAVSGDDVIIAEALNERTPGFVYVYRRSGGGWTEVQRLSASDAATADGFGQAVAVVGGDLLVGSSGAAGGVGAIYIFRRDDAGVWTESGTLMAGDGEEGDGFGRVIAVGGGVALASASASGDGRGAVHVLTRSETGEWSEAARLMASDGQPGDGFGMAAATDGEFILVGAPGRARGTGAAHVYRRGTDGSWVEMTTLEPEGEAPSARFGMAVAVAGGRLLVGAPEQDRYTGAVYGYALDESSGEWLADGRYRAYEGGLTGFGSSIAVDGGDIWIGAPMAGVLEGRYYVASTDADGGWGALNSFAVDGLARRDQMGSALALGASAGVVGLPEDDFGMGTAVIIERRNGGWTRGVKVASEVAGLDAITGGDVACEDGSAEVFDCDYVDIVSFLPVDRIGGNRGVEVNDMWGWTDPVTGTEWALVGRYDGTSFIDLSDPGNPRYVGDLPLTEGANPSVWRDIKVYRDHAYIVSDGAGEHGMQIFDLAQLRDVTGPPVTFEATALYWGIHSAHNVIINEDTGFAYTVGSNGGGNTCGGGLHMMDIRDPLNPVFVGCFTSQSGAPASHDAMCITYDGPDEEHRGSEICFGSNGRMFSIADVTDKSAPVELAASDYPNTSYTHQGWIDEAHEYFYMNDEIDEVDGSVPSTRTLIWDVRDLDDPILAAEHFSENRASDHNLYILGDLMYQSNYRSGLRILDISDRENPVEIGFLDTVPYGEDEPGFAGSWSNYPYFESGIIVVTSGKEGVFVVRRVPRVLIP